MPNLVRRVFSYQFVKFGLSMDVDIRCRFV